MLSQCPFALFFMAAVELIKPCECATEITNAEKSSLNEETMKLDLGLSDKKFLNLR